MALKQIYARHKLILISAFIKLIECAVVLGNTLDILEYIKIFIRILYHNTLEYLYH